MYSATLQKINNESMEVILLGYDFDLTKYMESHRENVVSSIDTVLMRAAKETFVVVPTIIIGTYNINLSDFQTELRPLVDTGLDEYFVNHHSVKDLVDHLKSVFTGCTVGVRIEGVCLRITVSVRLIPTKLPQDAR